jgi:hypothetical protein
MGGAYVDAFMRGLQGALTKIKALRFGPLSVRLGVEGLVAIRNDIGEKGAAVAKIIEFYVPSNFRKKEKWVPPQDRGKILEFSLQTKKSA